MTAGLVSHHLVGAGADEMATGPEVADEDRAALVRLVAGLRTIDTDLDELLSAPDRGGVLAPTEVVAVVERALGAAVRRLEADAELQRARTHLVSAGALPAVALLLELVGADRATVQRATGGALTAPDAPLEIPDDLARQLGWLDEIDLREPAPGFQGFWDEAVDPPMLHRLRRWARGDAS